MSRPLGAIARFAPPLAIMALIWFLSDQPGLSSGLSFDHVLRKCAHMLTQQSLHRLDMFDRARRASLLSRPVYLLRSGVYRQTWDGQLALILATFAKRI